MTKTRSTKHALILSAFALLLCVSMLIGSTYAWFTDSVTSSGNKIVSGKLDVELYLNTGDGNGYVDISDDTTTIFDMISNKAQDNNADTLWEPGKTQVAYLMIKNAGNLALKYSVALKINEVTNDLYKAMRYAITPDARFGDVTAWDAAAAEEYVVVLYATNILEPDTDVQLFSSVTVPNWLEVDDANTMGNTFSVTVKAEAVQSDNTNYSTAKAAFENLVD